MDQKSIEQDILQKNLTAPRVTLAELEANIVETEVVKHVSTSGKVLRWAVLTLRNGFAATGKPSCSASVENDNEEIGNKVAIANAKDSVWELMGYELHSRLAALSSCSDPGNAYSHPVDEKLQPHQQRVIVEHAELQEKLGKLDGFLRSDALKALDEVDQEHLWVQRGVMQDYLRMLELRIARF